MGFEQLAALRDQLAAQAKKDGKNAASERKPQGKKPAGDKPRGDRPQGEKQRGDKPQGARPHGAKPQGNKPAAKRQQPAQETDPVILAIARLQRRFPKTFPKHPEPKFPLKLGIHKDLILQSTDLQLNEEEIRSAIKTWCEGRRYWTAMVEGAARLDLQGEPSGAVTTEEALRAKRLSARARSKAYQARKQASQPAGAAPTAEAAAVVAEAAAVEAVVAGAVPAAEAVPAAPPDSAADAPAHLSADPASIAAAVAPQPAEPFPGGESAPSATGDQP